MCKSDISGKIRVGKIQPNIGRSSIFLELDSDIFMEEMNIVHVENIRF